MASDSPTLCSDLLSAAAELVNCEASSDANADEQLRLATALRAAHVRLRGEMETYARLARHGTIIEAPAVTDALRRINNGPLEPTP